MIPLLVFLCASAIGVAYMCYQGVKVQSAANYAARIQGEERVAGGNSVGSIDTVNGTRGNADADPTTGDPSQTAQQTSTNAEWEQNVYGRYRKAVRDMFGDGEKQHLFVPRPQIGNEIDQVKVVRVMQPPTVFGHVFQAVKVEGTAYGGEDVNMYALPRFGCTPGNCTNNHYYWQKNDVLSKGNDSSNNVLGN